MVGTSDVHVFLGGFIVRELHFEDILNTLTSFKSTPIKNSKDVAK